MVAIGPRPEECTGFSKRTPRALSSGVKPLYARAVALPRRYQVFQHVSQIDSPDRTSIIQYEERNMVLASEHPGPAEHAAADCKAS